jgi:hypothetical protein
VARRSRRLAEARARLDAVKKARASARVRLARAIERNTKAAERIHRAVAGFPLDVLEQIDRLRAPVGRLRKLQDRSITARYALVRGVEREVVRLARARSVARRRAARPKRAKPVAVHDAAAMTARAS